MKDETVGERTTRTQRRVVPRDTRAVYVLEALRLLPAGHEVDVVAAALRDEWREAIDWTATSVAEQCGARAAA